MYQICLFSNFYVHKCSIAVWEDATFRLLSSSKIMTRIPEMFHFWLGKFLRSAESERYVSVYVFFNVSSSSAT